MIFHGIPLDCINHAALAFHVPAKMIVSVIQTENGWNGAAIKNKNGTRDLGVMQINSIWLKEFKSAGITEEALQYDPCANVYVGTWILAKGISKGEGWKGVANYHSMTPAYNLRYQKKVKSIYDDIDNVLKSKQ